MSNNKERTLGSVKRLQSGLRWATGIKDLDLIRYYTVALTSARKYHEHSVQLQIHRKTLWALRNKAIEDRLDIRLSRIANAELKASQELA